MALSETTITLTDDEWTEILDCIGPYTFYRSDLNELFIKIKSKVYPDEN